MSSGYSITETFMYDIVDSNIYNQVTYGEFDDTIVEGDPCLEFETGDYFTEEEWYEYYWTYTIEYEGILCLVQ